MFLSISILLCGALLMCSASDQQHSSFYGICTPNNSSDAIYSQTIHIKNSGIVQRPPQPIRQWMISVRDIFRRRNPTTVPSTLSDVRISQILTYPPFVSTEHVERPLRVPLIQFFMICRANATNIRSSALNLSIYPETELVGFRRSLVEALEKLGHGFN